jgi:nitroreductase
VLNFIEWIIKSSTIKSYTIKFTLTSHKIDVGHVCQNLYLANESVGAGACAIGIYDQKLIDEILELDGDEEFVLYLAAVGKK